MNPTNPSTYDYSELARALRAQFSKDASFSSILTAVLILTAMVVSPYLLNRLLEFLRNPPAPNNDHRLFQVLVRRLGLAPSQRRILRRMVRELDLELPVTILISEELFQESLKQWQGRQPGRTGTGFSACDSELWNQIRCRLFPRDMAESPT